MLAARVEDIARTCLHGDVQPERVQSARCAAGAGGDVRGERVEVHVVERQSDAVVAEIGQQGERVVEAQIGEAVGAVAEAEWWQGRARGRGFQLPGALPGIAPVASVSEVQVMLTRLASRRATGARAAVISAVAVAPERAMRAAWRGMVARMPAPTARWVSGGDGLREACR